MKVVHGAVTLSDVQRVGGLDRRLKVFMCRSHGIL
jgi:hypothetical protein